ncbi:hypothetical protein DFQ30_007830 [Apophysomyces sp. BC1015]|nr:hypothetical protein DFQ30_007830 [Apophysomyces sp. BC1015]KAG0181944.1 hypothetical protein DFQ29_006476 [Apophysomyces sp. BC1021]
MELGSYRSTTYQNATTSIFFSPIKYRAIRPRDVTSILGFETTYVDIVTLESQQQTWPMHPNINLTRGDYHGMFSVQLSKGTMDIKTEQRMHTALQAVAMAGGAYGVLTTLYILLFGMTRLTPWGLVHHLPVLVGRANRKLLRQPNMENYDNGKQEQHATASSTSPKIGFSWLSRKTKPSKDQSMELENSGKEIDDSKYRKELEDDQGSDQYLLSDPTSPRFLSVANNYYPLQNEKFVQEHLDLQSRSKELESRVEELEMILREYFLNTDYLDQLHLRRQNRPDLATVARQRQSITRPRRGLVFDRNESATEHSDGNDLVEVVTTCEPSSSSSDTVQEKLSENKQPN